jgi:protein HIRA/HIR1
LIGHEGPVEVCAFSPRLFNKIIPGQRTADGRPISSLVTVIACAGQDKALSVWITSNPRPLVIAQDLAVKAISDLAWSPDGKNLFATSLDGSIVAVMFTDDELGRSASMDENEKALAKFGGGRRGAGIIEGPGGLLLEEKSKEGELRDVEGRMGALMGDAAPAPAAGNAETNGPSKAISMATNGNVSTAESRHPIPNGVDDSSSRPVPKDPHAEKLEKLKQRVTITKDGKKRIAPLLVSTSTFGESSLPRSQLMASSDRQSTANDGPKTILDLSKPFDGLPKGGLATLLLGNKRKLAPSEGDDEGHVEKKLAAASRNGETMILSNAVEGLVPAQITAPISGQVPTPEFIRPAVLNPSLSVSQLRLAVPKLRAHIVQTYGGSLGTITNGQMDNTGEGNRGTANAATQTHLMFEARNPTGPSLTGRHEDREPARLAVTKRGQPVWQDFLPKSVLLMSIGQDFWAVACEDGSIYAWTSAGRRIFNALILESQAVILESKDSRMLCITATGLCYVWDVKSLTSPHPPVSLAPILDIATQGLQAHPTKGPSITSAHLNSEGRIFVTLSNGDGYGYSPAMFVWQRLSEIWWAVGSQYWNTTDSSVGNLNTLREDTRDAGWTNVAAGIIPYLEKHTTSETLVRGRAYFLQRLVKQLLSREGYEGFESSVSIAHLENRLAAAMMLGAKEEFQVYLLMYTRRLGAEGLKAKVEELLLGLLGEIYEKFQQNPDTDQLQTIDDRKWNEDTKTLCGWPRKDLLKAVVLILGL